MKRLLVILVILAFVLVGCEKQTEQNTLTNNGGGNQQPSAPQQPATTTVTQNPPETTQNDGNSKQDLLDKIDWNSIEDETIILLVDEFGAVEYVGTGANEGGRLFVPDKQDLLEFINNYEFNLTALEENGKTVYILTEIKKKPAPITDGFDLLPPEVQDAFENLLDHYPTNLNPGGANLGGGTGGEVAY
jgi:hypothetical protein